MARNATKKAKVLKNKNKQTKYQCSVATTRFNQFDTLVFFGSSVPHLKVWDTFKSHQAQIRHSF